MQQNFSSFDLLYFAR